MTRKALTASLHVLAGMALLTIGPIAGRADVMTVRINGNTVPCATQLPGPAQLSLTGTSSRLKDVFNCTVSFPGEGSFQVTGSILATNAGVAVLGFNSSLAFQVTVVAISVANPIGTIVTVDVKQLYDIPTLVGAVSSNMRVDGVCNTALSVAALDFFVNGAQNPVLNTSPPGPSFPCPTITARQTGGGPGAGAPFIDLEQVGSVVFPAGSGAGDAVNFQMQQVAFNTPGGGLGPFLPPPAGLPPSFNQLPCPPYRCDDGTAENALGITPPNSAIAWMNGFTIQPGNQTISSISLTFGRPTPASGLTNGQPVTVYLWMDPTGTGSPFSLQVLGSAVGITTNVDSNTFNVFPIGPVTLPVGTKIFAGAILRQSGFQTPASVDLNSPRNNSWLRGWDPSSTPDPNNMGTNQFGQPAMINLESTVVPGVFMIRVN